jgi:predicted outer membrane repeat protein
MFSSAGGGGIFNNGVLVVDGSTIGSNSAAHGGGVFNSFFGTATIQRESLITENSANASGVGGGGGIDNTGNLTLDASVIRENIQSGIQNAATFSGGGTATIQGGTLITENSALVAGGISNSGTLMVDGSTISNNTGSGIYNFRSFSDVDGGTVTIQGGSLITGNSAINNGGGIRNSATVTVQGGSIISGNFASGGGGIHNSDTLTVNGATISSNTATQGGGINSSGTVTIQDGSMIAGNSATNIGGGIANSVSGSMFISDDAIINGNSADADGGGIYNANLFNQFGGSIYGAKVEIERISGGSPKNVGSSYTSESGEFVFRFPEKADRFRITATAKGVSASKEIEVGGAAVYRLAITLELPTNN